MPLPTPDLPTFSLALIDSFDWAGLGAALLICLARIVDVSLGTIRTIYTLRGKKVVGTAIGVVECSVYLMAISSVVSQGLNDPYKVVGYVVGFSLGIYVGVTIEGWIASGWTMIRAVVREEADSLVARLRIEGHAVTRIRGEGRDGPAPILFIVCRRKRARDVLRRIRESAPDAFVTVDSVGQAINGTIANVPRLTPRLLNRK